MDQKNVCGCNKALKGINCDVTHCTYNAEGTSCHAPEISVGPSYANSSAETICATFKPREEQ
ncbi:MAG: DUF1540 domain-containing protein [Clostridia bacterium]|nr:DUF1540 domain-containing protein [Clostridia bacterium]